VPSYCMPMYACQLWSKYKQTSIVWSAYVLHITISIEFCITYPEILVFAHTRLSIVSGPLMPCWETTCIDFLYDAHLRLTFLLDRFKCLMLFRNLHFSSFIQHSCMVETECSSCSWVISVFASHQYCFCVVKICWYCVHTKHKKKLGVLGKCFALVKVGHVLTPVVWCTAVWLSIFSALANNDTAVVRIKCFAPPNVGHVQTLFL